MAITLYTGDPGAGKSHGAIEHVLLPSLEQGRTIVTNIPLYKGKLHAYTEEQGWPEPKILEADIEDILETPSKLLQYPNGSVFLLDETWLLFPAGQRVNQAPSEFKVFFKMHRHRTGGSGHTDQIILLTQHPDDIASWVRNMVTETYWMTKLDKVGRPNDYRVDVHSSCPGARGKKSQVLRRLFGSYKEDVYRFYISQTQNKSERWGHANEEKVDKRANILNAPLVKYGVPISVLLVLFGTWTGVKAFNRITVDKSQSSPSPVSNPNPAPAPPVPQQVVKTRVEVQQPALEQEKPRHVQQVSQEPSTEWRLVAYLLSEAKGRFYALGRSGMREIPREACFIPDGIDEWRCLVDGHIVAQWTGQSMSAFGNSSVEVTR